MNHPVTRWLCAVILPILLLASNAWAAPWPGNEPKPPSPDARVAPPSAPLPFEEEWDRRRGRLRIDIMKEAQSPVSTIAASLTMNGYFDLNKKTPGAVSMLFTQPQKLDDSWHVVHRVSVGLPYVPLSLVTPPGGPAPPAPEFGLGDLNYTPYLAPNIPGRLIAGFGPSITIPTASGRLLGTGKFLAGPSFVWLHKGKNAMVGVLATQQWSVGGDRNRSDVSAATIQPLFFYNFPSQWYLVSTPRIYANWNSRQGSKWLLPIGGGVGRFFRIGKQNVNMSLQAFYHLERPYGALWSANLQFQLLFPTSRPER